MPEWYMVNIVLVVLSMLSILWKPLLMALPLLVSHGRPSPHKCYQKHGRDFVHK